MRSEIKINHAHSMDDGIQFYSKRHKGCVAIATADKSGNIKTEWTTIKEYKNKQDKIAKMKKDVIFILCVLPFTIIFAILLEWAIRQKPILGLRFFLIGYAFMILSMFIIRNIIKRRKEKNNYKFHSAEHMVINAYRELKRVPTLKEIRGYSRFSNTCGTNETTVTVISGILMFFCTFLTNQLYMLMVMLAGNIIILILLRFGYLNFLQRYTTAVPTEIELRVAIEGMRVWLENEKKEKERSRIRKILQKLFPRAFY